MPLTAKTCTPCQGGIPPLSRREAERYLTETPGWMLNSNATEIKRSFEFPDFQSAMEFAQRVGELAEQENHHPDVTFGWGYCRVLLQTRKINGLHENDFILAAKINGLAQRS